MLGLKLNHVSKRIIFTEYNTAFQLLTQTILLCVSGFISHRVQSRKCIYIVSISTVHFGRFTCYSKLVLFDTFEMLFFNKANITKFQIQMAVLLNQLIHFELLIYECCFLSQSMDTGWCFQKASSVSNAGKSANLKINNCGLNTSPLQNKSHVYKNAYLRQSALMS